MTQPKTERYLAEPYGEGDPYYFKTQAEFYDSAEDNFLNHDIKPQPTAYSFFDEQENKSITFEEIPA